MGEVEGACNLKELRSKPRAAGTAGTEQRAEGAKQDYLPEGGDRLQASPSELK